MTGRDKFTDLFETIRHARHHIHLEYFNFRNDSIANALFDLLAEKVKEGVEVRAMFDAFGNWSNNQPLKKRHLQAIKARGIEIIKFDPITFPYINHAMHRDHRKIVVIDGKIGYTGFHHSKVMMVDSSFCTVGTANLNSRSLRYDYETNAFIFDPLTTHQLNSMFERDKKNSTLLTPEIWKKRSGWKKFIGWVGNLLTPFL